MKPKICEILGVELHEIFEYEDATFRIVPECDDDEHGEQDGWVIEEKGKNIYTGGWDGDIEAWQLIDMIQHPEKIKRGGWTEQDVTDADDLQFIMPDLVKVERADTERIGDIRLWTKDGTFSWIRGAMFPSLKVGEKVGLDEILGGAEMNAPETVKSYIVRTQMERILHG